MCSLSHHLYAATVSWRGSGVCPAGKSEKQTSNDVSEISGSCSGSAAAVANEHRDADRLQAAASASQAIESAALLDGGHAHRSSEPEVSVHSKGHCRGSRLDVGDLSQLQASVLSWHGDSTSASDIRLSAALVSTCSFLAVSSSSGSSV